MKQRQRLILEAMLNIGRWASTQEIAMRVGLNTNGVSQSLSALSGEYLVTEKRKKNDYWKIIAGKNVPPLSKPLWEKLNARRVELIKKDTSKGLPDPERLELADLQKTARRMIERKCSLKPINRQLKKLEQTLKSLPSETMVADGGGPAINGSWQPMDGGGVYFEENIQSDGDPSR